MRAVLLTGTGVAFADGVVLGVALGVGSTVVAICALTVGIAAAVVLGWVTPDARPADDGLVTLGTRPTPEPEQPEPEADVTLDGAPGTVQPVPVAAARRSLPTPAAA